VSTPRPLGRCTHHSHACLQLAFSWLLAAHGDTHVRGCLKEPPQLAAYRLELLAPVLDCVRAKCMAELSTASKDTSDDPGAEHHQEVADFLNHQCNCDWCPCGSQGDVEEHDPNGPYADLLRAIDALGDGDIIQLGRRMSELALAPDQLAGVYDAIGVIIDVVLSSRAPERGAG
jgi:hypothetical protein